MRACLERVSRAVAPLILVIRAISVTKEHLPNEHIPEDIIEENGKVGALFASKALVQLLINPCVGSITNYYGYSVPFIFGTIVLFISSMSKCTNIIANLSQSSTSTKLG